MYVTSANVDFELKLSLFFFISPKQQIDWSLCSSTEFVWKKERYARRVSVIFNWASYITFIQFSEVLHGNLEVDSLT